MCEKQYSAKFFTHSCGYIVMTWSGFPVLRGQEVLLGHEQLDDNITKVTPQLLQRQSQDEGSRAPSMRRICRSNQAVGFQLVTTEVLVSCYMENPRLFTEL